MAPGLGFLPRRRPGVITHSVQEAGSLVRRRQPARVAFAEPAISVVGNHAVSGISNPAREHPAKAQQPPEPAEPTVNLECRVRLVVNPRFIHVDH